MTAAAIRAVDLVRHTMQVQFHDDPDSFRARATAYLVAREASHNLLFGLLEPIAAGHYEAFWLATIEHDDVVVGCALQTPPFPAVLSHMSPTALETLLETLRARDPSLSGVNGPVDLARAFATTWCERTGASWETTTARGVYQLDAVTPPTRPPTGRLRTAVLADAPLAAEWIDAFRRDAAIGSPAPADEVARRRIEEGSLWLWEDGGEPVSLCAFAGPTPHGIRINCVYTPPERRARGYASAAVAALSQRLLDRGRAFCFLFTDLANPTSNRIYRAIGYRQVAEHALLRFRTT